MFSGIHLESHFFVDFIAQLFTEWHSDLEAFDRIVYEKRKT
ncbi:hypothetical protein RV13_GL000362 [Enterococcus raffinosus]|nr:hypothetical protein RV13_GL000362 [Enterococcus raffinosus]